jgi:peptide methionine sulfoxide reductase msrA/msrB
MRGGLFLILGALMMSALVFAQTRSAPAAPPLSGVEGSGWRTLSPEEAQVVEACGTERAFTGRYVNHKEKGTYTCTRCGAPLFASGTKFDSRSGWPAFDDTIEGAVRELPDTDGSRVEIRCARCDGHLGHVFRGEGFTSSDTRHCVNSVSMGFSDTPLAEAFFAGGCFWGVEHLLETLPGVDSVVSGYMGGTKQSPTYEEICTGRTGHTETVRVRFDPSKTNYEALAKMFFEIHDPTQVNRQGPDRGPQYRSAIFVTDKAQEVTTRKLIKLLEAKGLTIATQVERAGIFWPAEAYHQDYYVRTGKAPYCHSHTPRF